jgi:hypothetical protein
MINNPTADMFKPGGTLNPTSAASSNIPTHANTDMIVNGVPTPVQDVEEDDIKNMSENDLKEYLEKLIQYGKEQQAAGMTLSSNQANSLNDELDAASVQHAPASTDLVQQSDSEKPQHVVVLSFQEENWEDDGGTHCPIILKLTPTQLAWLDGITGTVSEDDPMVLSIGNAPTVTLPANVERVETVWLRLGY